MIKLLIAVLLCLSVLGCSSVGEYIKEPTLNYVTIVPIWSTPEQIKAACNVHNAAACAQVGEYNGQALLIWVRKPVSFSDTAAVCAIGHEVLHTLGATHE